MTRLRCQLSERQIKSAISQPQISELKDEQSPLLLRFHKSRITATFYWLSHQANKTKWFPLGGYPALSCKQARQLMRRAQVNQLRQSTNDKPTTVAVNTVNELIAWYQQRLQWDKNLANSTKRRVNGQLENHLKQHLGQIAISQLSREKINRELIEKLLPQLHHATLRNCYQTLRQALQAAHGAGMIECNPIAHIKFKELCSQSIQPRATRLTPAQIPMLLQQIQTAKPPLKLLLLLLISYGTRLSETLFIRWQDIDWKQKRIYLPAEHTKTRQEHQLPLTPNTLKWLRTRQGQPNSAEVYVFGNRKTDIPPSASAIANQIRRLSKRHWSAHDLRKLARTTWLELGIDHVIAEFLLNHNLPQVQRAYIQTLADERCYAAIELWQNHLFNNKLTAL